MLAAKKKEKSGVQSWIELRAGRKKGERESGQQFIINYVLDVVISVCILGSIIQ